MRLDLHVHTTFSDGDYTPRQIAAMAAAAGLDGVAITDHDECRGFGETEPAPGLLVIPGIEIAAHEADCEVHVLGLDIDWQNAAMLEYVTHAGGGRRRRASAVADKLRSAGYDISMSDIESECRGDAIGRPHMAAALVRKGYADSTDDAFARFVGRQAPFYVPLEKIGVEQAAALIIQAGGKPVLAHPGLLRDGIFDRLAPRLDDMGFWGIEAYHPAHTDGQCRIYESEARRLRLCVTSGSDFHGAAGQGTGLGQETRGGSYLKESVGKLLKSTPSRPDIN